MIIFTVTSVLLILVVAFILTPLPPKTEEQIRIERNNRAMRSGRGFIQLPTSNLKGPPPMPKVIKQEGDNTPFQGGPPMFGSNTFSLTEFSEYESSVKNPLTYLEWCDLRCMTRDVRFFLRHTLFDYWHLEKHETFFPDSDYILAEIDYWNTRLAFYKECCERLGWLVPSFKPNAPAFTHPILLDMSERLHSIHEASNG